MPVFTSTRTTSSLLAATLLAACAQFLLPSRPDVSAFHEGFADVVLLHHFAYRAVRVNGQSRSNLRDRRAFL
jgi:hypothetical protein